MRNIQFFKISSILPHSHPDLEFADCISLKFECQKRQDMHDTVTQEVTGDSALCLVSFAADLIRHIMSYPGTSSNTNLSAYMSNSSVKHVTSWQVINALRYAVCAFGKACLGISKEEFRNSAPTPSDWAPQWPCTWANARCTQSCSSADGQATPSFGIYVCVNLTSSQGGLP
jgi:hypothetical protein